ncbi:MAG TPA: tripartite tricarboxylate transporter substrate binding protein [Burkholderiales bacterium]|nr:tripartite tricarboxylate transporter substrate binding protein [Burkholderiales bacterium]
MSMQLAVRRTAAALILPCSIGGAGVVSGAIAAEAYPSRPIRMVVPFAPRGTSDVVARIIAEKLEPSLAQTVVIDNRPGAGGTLGAGITAQANPDGYTMLYAAKSIAINASLYRNLPYDALRDLSAVTLVQETPYLFVVNDRVPVKSIKELIALAKAQPKKLNYASGGAGTGPQMAMELLKLREGFDIVHVPYKGSAPALRDVVAGYVQVQCSSLIAAVQFLGTGRLRPLAVSTAKRSPKVPDVPTMIESGIPGYDESGWSGILVPAGTSKAIVARLNQAINATLREPAVVRSMELEGSTPHGSTPAEYSKRLVEEVRKWAEVIRRTGLRAN